MEIVKNYLDNDLDKSKVKAILEDKRYSKICIAESTEKALERKCKIILEAQKMDWKPLCVIYREFIRIYEAFYYLERKD